LLREFLALCFVPVSFVGSVGIPRQGNGIGTQARDGGQDALPEFGLRLITPCKQELLQPVSQEPQAFRGPVLASLSSVSIAQAVTNAVPDFGVERRSSRKARPIL
jgi:hypothetical protein